MGGGAGRRRRDPSGPLFVGGAEAPPLPCGTQPVLTMNIADKPKSTTSAPYAWLAVSGVFWLAGVVAMAAFATPGRIPGSTAFPWGLPLACLAGIVASAVDVAAMKRKPEAAVIAVGLGSVMVGLTLMGLVAAR